MLGLAPMEWWAGHSPSKKGALSKSDAALNGILEYKESYRRGYLPDSPSVLS
jgi:hypothetical protein